jgi:hypothetical protein
MHVHENRDSECKRQGQRIDRAAPKEALTQWLESSPAAKEFVAEVRRLQSELPQPGSIDRLETRAAQSLKFLDVLSLGEKLLNEIGMESRRQSTLREQAEQGTAQAAELKRVSRAVGEAIASKVDEFVSTSFQHSPDLQNLKAILNSFLATEARRKRCWEYVEHDVETIEHRARNPFFEPSLGLEFLTPKIIISHANDTEALEELRKVTDRVYEKGRQGDTLLVMDMIRGAGPRVREFLANNTLLICSADAAFSEAVNPLSDGFRAAAEELVSVADLLNHARPQRPGVAPTDTSLDLMDRITSAREGFLVEAQATLELIAKQEQDLKARISAHIGLH